MTTLEIALLFAIIVLIISFTYLYRIRGRDISDLEKKISKEREKKNRVYWTGTLKETKLKTEKKLQPKLRIKYFTEIKKAKGYFRKHYQIKYYGRFYHDNIPIGGKFTMQTDIVRKINVKNVNKILDNYVKPLSDLAVDAVRVKCVIPRI